MNDTERNEALFSIAIALNALGLADADTRMGALEVVAKELRDGLAGIREELSRIANIMDESTRAG